MLICAVVSFFQNFFVSQLFCFVFFCFLNFLSLFHNSMSKAEKRAARLRKEAELEDKLAARESRNRRPAAPARPPPRVQGFWNQLPIPFIARLFSYLSVPEIQRCLSTFQWPQQQQLRQFCHDRFRAFSREQGTKPFSSERPRKHRFYVTRCSRCKNRGEVRICDLCQQPVCKSCEFFVSENRAEKMYWCSPCTTDRFYNGT